MPEGPYLRPEKFDEPDLFRQLEYELPTANTYRTASGAPALHSNLVPACAGTACGA